MALPAKYNVIAAFPTQRTAETAVRKLAHEGVNRTNVRVLRPGDGGDRDQVSELRAEMQEEVAEGFAAPGVALVTPQQARGVARGTIIGGTIGVVLGVLFGLVWAFGAEEPLGPLTRFVIAAIPFAVGGTVAGAVAGGALKPRMEAQDQPHRNLDDRRLAGERDVVVAVHVTNKRAAERACRVLEESGAERIDAVNADGTPLPPQSGHPRPADPPGRWWWRGRSEG